MKQKSETLVDTLKEVLADGYWHHISELFTAAENSGLETTSDDLHHVVRGELSDLKKAKKVEGNDNGCYRLIYES